METTLTRYLSAFPAAALFLLFIPPSAGDPPPDGYGYGYVQQDPDAVVSAEDSQVGLQPVSELRTPASIELLRVEVHRLIASTSGWNSEWGVLAVSLTTGDTLLAVDPDRPLLPASNQKLVTAAAALHHLGPDFRFATYLLARGPIRDGVLHGDLVLYGTGDPTFADAPRRGAEAAFPRFLEGLRAMGIEEIRGAVLGDETHFQGPFRRAGWNPASLNDWYAAPASALTFNENVATLRVRAAQAGSPPLVSTIPESADLPMENQSLSVAGRPGFPFMAVRDDPDMPIVFRGQLTAGSREVWRVITVSDPPSYAASVFRSFLEKEGVKVHGGARSIRDPGDSPLGGAPGNPLRTVAVHHSPPLRDLLPTLNVESHNLFAELLVFALGRVMNGKGSFEEGTAVLSDYLTGVIGTDPSGVRLDDGSGLSRDNRLTAGSLVRVLQHMAQAGFEGPFWTSLPQAGDRRGLGRMHRSAAAGNLRAKTGTIQGVSSLSGIVHTADGEPVAFSILANRVSTSSAKRIEDQIGIRLASFIRAAGPGPVPAPDRPGPVSASR